MKTIKLITSTLFFIMGISSYAQTLKGKVVEKTDKGTEPIAGASVYWLNTTIGITTDKNGEFEIKADSIQDKRLIVRYIGYKTDTIDNPNKIHITINLKEDSKTLNEVTISGERPDVFIPSTVPIKTEIITQKELTKGACCDLAGCFNTSASVQPTVTNIVTNAQELRVLGLSGIYNQVLIDGMPLIQGLSYTYGISSIPGTLVDNIYVSKGANSVLQGYESMSGQINVELKEPDKSVPMEIGMLNLYINSFLEKQFNANYSSRLGREKKWSNITAVQTVQPANKIDNDDDNFLDLPLLTRYMFYDKIKFSSQDSIGFSTYIGLGYLNEQRIGGQKNFNPATDKGDTLIYGQTTNIQQPEIYTKTGFRFNPKNAITLISSAFQQQQNSYFGETNYKAEQTNFYANLQYELKWRKNNELKTGSSFRYHNLEENISFTHNIINKTYGGKHLLNEQITGAFAESIFRFYDDRLMFIAGIRVDNHPAIGGRNFITPRALLKYEIAEQTNFRASIGKGWRTVNLFSENINLLASQRDITVTEILNPEEAINYGANFTHNFEKEKISGSFSIDFYRTQFQNQIFPDYDTDPTKAYISNFTGISVSNGFQSEVNLKFHKVFSVKVAYNYLDVYRIVNGSKYVLPFNSTHKILSTLSYKPFSEKWHFDTNIHWYGEQNLPNTSANPIEFQRPEKSKPYTLINVQFTKSWTKFETYIGCENTFDFRQKQPITSWQNPFSPYFDTSSVWGPTRGREWYLGIRIKLA